MFAAPRYGNLSILRCVDTALCTAIIYRADDVARFSLLFPARLAVQRRRAACGAVRSAAALMWRAGVRPLLANNEECTASLSIRTVIFPRASPL